MASALLERQAVGDKWLDLPSPYHRSSSSTERRSLSGACRAVVPERAAERRAVLDQEPVGRNLLHASDESHEEQAPAPAERGQRGIRQLAPDGIEADVGAFVTRQRHHSVRELLRGVVDEVIGAVLAGHGQLLRGAGARDHARAHRLADLDGGEADAARRSQHEQRLAGLEASLPAEGHVARDVRDGKGTGFVEGHARGHGEGFRLFRDGLLGEPAVGQRGHHAVAGPKARHGGTAPGDDPGRLDARAERERGPRLIAPGHHDGVGVVHG